MKNLLKEIKPIYDHEKAIEFALKTWYPIDHPLHFNPHHPLGKLLGEWGELLDDYMKGEYKPGYVFEPLDELGDISYYLRILDYQESHQLNSKSVDLKIICKCIDCSTDCLIVKAIECAVRAFQSLRAIGWYSTHDLDIMYAILLEIAQQHNLTFDDLIQSNWEKLKPGSERGDQWMKAR